ncbi:hypothetical protein EVG20_g3772 [Dentipellis fragilis]|uniref:Uncharacterized protein n=1 Tax=Dentipellis fragilis TaxID=205917 RepID=A0A4Y9Z041_9AGAM|nr:hypothetical protein EVG20_g3772 [Dentipellis fragilis]
MHVPSVLWISIALAGMSAHATPALRGLNNEARRDIPEGLSPSEGLPPNAASASTVHLPSALFPPSVTVCPAADIATPTPNTPNGAQPLPLPVTKVSREAGLETRMPRRGNNKSPRAIITSWPVAAVTGSINDYRMQRDPQPGPRQ